MILLRQRSFSLFGRKESERRRLEPIIREQLPKEYDKLFELERELRILKEKADTGAYIEINPYTFNKKDWDIIDAYKEDENLIPICNPFGYNMGNAINFTIWYNGNDKKFYRSEKRSMLPCNFRQDFKQDLMNLLDSIKQDVENEWKYDKWRSRNPERKELVYPRDWEADYYEPCKKIINKFKF